MDRENWKKRCTTHDRKYNSQTNDELLTSRNKKPWTTQKKMERPNLRSCNRILALVLDVDEEE
jgi:hypothetical protein